MSDLLERYAEVAGRDAVEHLRQLAHPLEGVRVVHVNSTREGGGVAEILHKLIPLMQALGIDARWEVIEGTDEFFRCTKNFHNALQGAHVHVPDSLLEEYRQVNERNAGLLGELLEDAEIVFIHDPQPAALIEHLPGRRGKWIWRCHIDVSHPYRPVWKFLRPIVSRYDASIFHLPEFAQPLPHEQVLIPPSIDPLSEKNMDLPEEEVAQVFERFGLDPGKPMILQVSRFDRFKDPLGVIEASRIARKFVPHQLVLAGGSAADDPEGEAVLEEVRKAAEWDDDVHVLVLPSNAHRTINALQRAAHVVLQKSLREGFGLTVTEAMWKGKPVIGGDTGGIRLQVIDHFTGFRVTTPEGAALRIRYLLYRDDKRREMGERARRIVRENFLITRHVRDHLALMLSLMRGTGDRLEVGPAA